MESGRPLASLHVKLEGRTQTHSVRHHRRRSALDCRRTPALAEPTESLKSAPIPTVRKKGVNAKGEWWSPPPPLVSVARVERVSIGSSPPELVGAHTSVQPATQATADPPTPIQSRLSSAKPTAAAMYLQDATVSPSRLRLGAPAHRLTHRPVRLRRQIPSSPGLLRSH